jgi:putative membrane protein
MRPSLRVALAAAILPLAACAVVPDRANPFGSSSTASGGTGMSSSMSVADQAFLTQAAYGGLGEMTLGEIAARRGANAAVRDFGRRMATDHAAVNRELTALAQAKGATPPTAPDPGRQAVASSLAMLDGVNFDRQYIAQQRTEHDVAIALFEAHARDGSDSDLRDFARRTLPSLRSHANELNSLSTMAVSSTP